MNKVIVTKPMVGIFAMQVCAANDVTDDEIRAICNRENPAGTTNGWGTVVRTEDNCGSLGKEALPVPCADHPNDRQHFLVLC